MGHFDPPGIKFFSWVKFHPIYRGPPCRFGLGISPDFLTSPVEQTKQTIVWVVVSSICFVFTPIWGRFPFWLIFFNHVETTNQLFFEVVEGVEQLNSFYWRTAIWFFTPVVALFNKHLVRLQILVKRGWFNYRVPRILLGDCYWTGHKKVPSSKIYLIPLFKALLSRWVSFMCYSF